MHSIQFEWCNLHSPPIKMPIECSCKVQISHKSRVMNLIFGHVYYHVKKRAFYVQLFTSFFIRRFFPLAKIIFEQHATISSFEISISHDPFALPPFETAQKNMYDNCCVMYTIAILIITHVNYVYCIAF